LRRLPGTLPSQISMSYTQSSTKRMQIKRAVWMLLPETRAKSWYGDFKILRRH
jgi:hypothetical protein